MLTPSTNGTHGGFRPRVLRFMVTWPLQWKGQWEDGGEGGEKLWHDHCRPCLFILIGILLNDHRRHSVVEWRRRWCFGCMFAHSVLSIYHLSCAVGCLCRRPHCCCMTRLGWRKPFCCAHPPRSHPFPLPSTPSPSAVQLLDNRLEGPRRHKSQGEGKTDTITWRCEEEEVRLVKWRHRQLEGKRYTRLHKTFNHWAWRDTSKWCIARQEKKI